MPGWLLSRLFPQNPAQPEFSLQGTWNWMRALAILVQELPDCQKESLAKRYSTVQRRPPDVDADTGVFENLLMAIHDLASLSATNEAVESTYDVIRSCIVSWYYCIYFGSKAMIRACSGADP